MTLAWDELVEKLFSGSEVQEKSKVKGNRKRLETAEEKRIIAKTRGFIDEIGKRGHKLRRMARALVDWCLEDKQLAHRIGAMHDNDDRLEERMERVLVRLTQILEEGMPDVALKQGSASFRVQWSSNPEASGRWHWKDGDHVDKWVSLRRASRQAAAVGGEFERSLAFKIADRMIEGLKHSQLHIPGFTMRTVQDVSEWTWEPPVVDLDGSDGGAADAATPDEAELVLFNRQPEFLVLGEYILAAESVADEDPVMDVKTLSKKVFIRIIERIGKLLKASTEDVFAAVKSTGVSVLQREIAKEPFDTKDVERFEKFMMLCETAEQALEIPAT